MKHVFVLDENIPVLAIKGEDDRGNKDPSAAELVRLVAQNCHRIAVHWTIWEPYIKKLAAIDTRQFLVSQAVSFFRNFMWNADKIDQQLDPLPEIPPGVTVPRKDHHIVRCALSAKARIVTTDGALRDAIRACPALGLRVLNPAEALELAASV